MIKKTMSKYENRFQEEILDLFLRLPFSKYLTTSELWTITKYMNIFKVKKKEVIFKEGEPGSFMCFIVEGKILVLKKSDKGKRVPIAELGPKRSLGEMAMIDQSPRSASAIAATDAILLTLSKKGFDKLTEDHPRIGVVLLKRIAVILCAYVRKTSSELADSLPSDNLTKLNRK
ncbi:MAG: cyclic nucleotide-binding domain-containing protein [Desulfobacteraceae bacterium]|jgi:CRP-like cAMP-binding protein